MLNRSTLKAEQRKGERERRKWDRTQEKRQWKSISARLKDAARDGKDYLFVMACDIKRIEEKLVKHNFLVVHLTDDSNMYMEVAISWGKKTEEELIKIYEES